MSGFYPLSPVILTKQLCMSVRLSILICLVKPLYITLPYTIYLNGKAYVYLSNYKIVNSWWNHLITMQRKLRHKWIVEESILISGSLRSFVRMSQFYLLWYDSWIFLFSWVIAPCFDRLHGYKVTRYDSWIFLLSQVIAPFFGGGEEMLPVWSLWPDWALNAECSLLYSREVQAGDHL